MVETCRVIMKASVRGRPECGMSAERSDNAGKAENRGNLSRGAH